MAEKILIVDDDPTFLQVMSEALRGAGYEVDTAEDGHSGSQKAINSPPDALVLDLKMPAGTGEEIFRRLRQYEATSRIPVLFVTGINREEAKKRIPAGFKTACLYKPFDIKTFIEAIQALLA